MPHKKKRFFYIQTEKNIHTKITVEVRSVTPVMPCIKPCPSLNIKCSFELVFDLSD